MKLIYFVFPLLLLIACTNSKDSNTFSKKLNISRSKETRINYKILHGEDTDSVELKLIQEFWSVTLPELDIESNEYLKAMISDAIRRQKVNPERDYVLVGKGDEPDDGMVRNSILVLIKVDSFFGEKLMPKELYDGYFYIDSTLVLTQINNPLKLTKKKNGEKEKFTLIELYDAPEINGDKNFYWGRYHLKNDSVFYYNPCGKEAYGIIDERELIAYRKPLIGKELLQRP